MNSSYDHFCMMKRGRYRSFVIIRKLHFANSFLCHVITKMVINHCLFKMDYVFFLDSICTGSNTEFVNIVLKIKSEQFNIYIFIYLFSFV